MKTLLRLPLITVALLHGFRPYMAYAQYCSDYDAEGTCNGDSYCTWDSTESICGCSLTYNVDLMFIFDGGSAYQSSSDFDEVKDFITAVVAHGAPASGFRLSLFPFTEGDNIEYPFNDTNSKSDNLAAIDALTLSSSDEADSREGYEFGIDHFNAQSSDGRRKIMVVMSAGDSTAGNICSFNSRDSNIYTFSITQGSDLDPEWQVGDLNLGVLQGVDCIVSERSRDETLIKLDSFSELNSGDSYLNRLEDQLCPRKELIRITEVQTHAVAGVSVGYVEMFNHGPPIDLTATTITLSTLDSTFTAQSAATWGTNEYLVVYNGETNDEYPRCEYCNCSKSDTTDVFCEDATYIYCANGGSPSQPSVAVDGDCQWTLPDGEDDWLVNVTIGGTEIDLVYRNLSDHEFPNIVSGFSAALRKIGYDNQYSSSWGMSCNETGTPGDKHYTLDDNECDIANCRKVTGSCDAYGNGGTCAGPGCTCPTGYWANGLTCALAPQVQNCVGLRETTSIGNYRITGLAGWDGFHRYTSRPCTDGTVGGECTVYGSGSTAGWGVFRETGERNDIEPSSFALSGADDFDNSNYTECELDTQAPTMAPTLSPTCALPPLEPCVAEIQQPVGSTWSYIVSWDTVGSVSFSCGNPTRWEVIRNEIVDDDGIGATRTSVTIANTQAFVDDTIVLKGVWADEDGRTDNVTCDVISIAPTAFPTKFPSMNPTEDPTRYPTMNPTQSPTYNTNATIPYCLVEFRSGTTGSANVYWDEPYIDPPNTPAINEIEYLLQWFDGGESERIAAENPNPQELTLNYDFSETVFQMRVEWESPAMIFNWTECEVTTLAPTMNPTKYPTSDPTANPTANPTEYPTRYPSGYPTMAPTYRPPELDECEIRFRQDLASVDIYWPGMILTDPVNYPDASDVVYEVIWDIQDDSDFVMGAFVHSEEDCIGTTVEGVNCTKFTRQQFSTTFDFDTDSACMEARYTSEAQSSDCVECSLVTVAPTLSPTTSPTPNPTVSPTFGPVHVYILADMCSARGLDEDRWEGVSMDGSDTTTSRRRLRRRMGAMPGRRLLDDLPSTTLGFEMSSTDESGRAGGQADERCLCEGWDCGTFYTPLQEFSEQQRGSGLRELPISRDYGREYIYNISVDWEISFVTEEMAQEYYLWNTIGVYNTLFERTGNDSLTVFVNDSVFEKEGYDPANPDPTNPGQYLEDIGVWQGRVYIDPGVVQSDILLSIYQEGIRVSRDQTDVQNEVFLISLVNCSILDVNDTEAQPDDSKDCTIGYPGRVFLVIEDTDTVNDEQPKNRKNNSWQGWFWYVLLAVCVVLGILGFMAYKWWTNAKMKDSAAAAVTEEYDDIIKEEDEGFGHDLAAENITNNPLADPVSHIRKTGPGLMDDEGEGMHTEIADRAQVTVEKFHVTETYGQTQATLGDHE